MLSRSVAFVIWALVAATGVFWGTRLFIQSEQAPLQATTTIQAALEHGDVSRLLGSNPLVQTTVEASSVQPNFGGRLRLAGVAAPKHRGAPGLAIISVDGNPPRAYRVGAVIDTDLLLQDVSWRTATVVMAHSGSYSGSEVILEMPALAIAERGVLPPAVIPVYRGSPATAPTLGGVSAEPVPDGRDALSAMEPPSSGGVLKGARTH